MKQILLIGLCVLFLGASGFLLQAYFQRGSDAARADKLTTVEILKVARDVRAGEAVSKPLLAWQTVDASTVTAGDLVKGTVAQTDLIPSIFAENLTKGSRLKKESLLTREDKGYLSLLLPPGYRAKNVTIQNLAEYNGLLHLGDKVDILLTTPREVGGRQGENLTAISLFRNVTVIGLDDSPVGEETGILMLALTLQDSVRASVAEKIGNLTIVLGGSAAERETSAPGEGRFVRLVDIISRPQEPSGAPPVSAPQKVRVIKGSKVSTVTLPGKPDTEARQE